MLRKMFLSSLCVLSTLATAQIELNLNAVLVRGGSEDYITRTIVVEENVPTIIEQDNLAAIVTAQVVDATTIIVQTELLEQSEAGELVSIAQPVVEVVENKQAVVTLGNAEGDSLVLSITFAFTE